MRQFIVFVFLLSFSFSSFSIKNPETYTQELSKVDRIYYTCKIWGYLKYYHPLVAKGSFDWDEKMQSVLKNTANIQTYESYSEYMTRWIYYMGQIKPCSKCNQPSKEEPFLKNFDLSWTQDSRFTDEFRKSLKNIENNRFQGNSHYVGQGNVQQFEPKNENPDYNFNWEDENSRLLPLFRYWNYIEYFYPYKYKTDQDWDDVLKEMIPKFLQAKSRLDFHLAMLELVVKVDDSHGGFITPLIDELPYFTFPSVQLEVIENRIVVTKIIDEAKAQQDDLQVGDVIVSVDGQDAISLHNSHKKHIWGSNDAVKNRSIAYTLFMGKTGSVPVSIQRNGITQSGKVSLYKSTDLNAKKIQPVKWENISDSIGYVDLEHVVVSDVDQIMPALMDKSVIIFDVRNYPRGTYRAISKYLNPRDTTFAIFTRPDYDYPGKFVWSGESTCGSKNDDYFKGKVILLVNEKTQSHAEFTCMCLQTAPNVTIVGSQTAGADGNVTKLRLLDRYYSSLTGIGVYYPNRSETQRIGIVPDIEVKPTLNGIRDGRDEVLDKAIKVAQEEVVRLIEVARLEEMARLEQMRLDSLRMDSLKLNMMKSDTLRTDSLKYDDQR